MATYSVLHLDDDALMLMKAETSLSDDTLGVTFKHIPSENAAEFWKKFNAEKPDCILLDLNLGTSTSPEGIQILRQLRAQGFSGAIVVFSGSADTRLIAEVVSAGATDFVTKSLEAPELAFRVVQAIRNVERTKHQTSSASAIGATMREVEARIPRLLASSVRSVLVLGATGTGKEVVAELFKSALAGRIPFVIVNSAAISKDLIESELFGYEKGAFTGAQASKVGLIPAADGGWIFLDEVARLSMGAQAALLRTLENGEVRPVGGTQTRKVKVRVLAATNEDLEDLVKQGEFRSDLLQRLRSYEILLPTLAERSLEEREEILDALLKRLNAELKSQKFTYALSHVARTLFLAAQWRQGNVREMWQTLQAAAVDAEGGLMTPACLPQSLLRQTRGEQDQDRPQPSLHKPTASFPVSLPELEDELCATLLNQLVTEKPDVAHSPQKIAEQLGVSRQSIMQRAKRLATTNRLPEALRSIFET